MRYLTNCVESTADPIIDMVDNSREITRRTFLKHVDRDDQLHLEQGGLGYVAHPSQGLTMARDWAVRYYKSKFEGNPCVYFDNSCIEYIFT